MCDVQHLSRGELESRALAGVRATALAVYSHVPFYRRAFDEAGFDPARIASLDDLARAPFVTKQDLRRAYPFDMLAVPLSEVSEVHMSSGTTGIATAVAYTAHDLEIWGECFSRGIAFAGGGPGDIVQVNYGYGLFTGGFGAHYGALASGAAVIPISAGNTERQVRILRDMGATIMCCTPSYAMHIADTAYAMGIDPTRDFKLRAGIHGAEAFSDALRAELERKLDYTVLDVYGLTETMGPGVAVECLAQNGLHIAEDHFYCEIVDPASGRVLPEGEWGELVITTLDREASPVVRYRTRDITRILPGECSCGCTHRRIDRLAGRTDDMLIIRGVNVFPSQIEDVMQAVPQVSSWYQIKLERVHALDVVTLLAEPTPEFDFDDIGRIESLQKEIQAKLKAALFVSIKVRLVEPFSIPRSEGKAQRIVDVREGAK